MNILLLSMGGDAVGLALRLQAEGHHVRFFREQPAKAGEGLVKPVLRNQRMLTKPKAPGVRVDEAVLKRLLDVPVDLVIADHWLFGHVGEAAWGCPTFGMRFELLAPQLSEEVNRQVLQACGIPVGSAGRPASLIAGFNAEDFTGPILLCMPQRGLMPGDLGVAVDCACFAATPVSRESRLVSTLLRPLVGFLAGYTGFVEVVLAGEKAVRVNFSAAPPHWAMFAEALPGGLGNYLHGVCTGRRMSSEVRGNWIAGALLSVPPYPYPVDVFADMAVDERWRLKGVTDQNRKHFWFLDVAERDGETHVAGDSGAVGIATAYANSIGAARSRVTRTLGAIDVEEAQYRTDIGRYAGQDLRGLEERGWLRPAAKEAEHVAVETPKG